MNAVDICGRTPRDLAVMFRYTDIALLLDEAAGSASKDQDSEAIDLGEEKASYFCIGISCLKCLVGVWCPIYPNFKATLC